MRQWPRPRRGQLPRDQKKNPRLQPPLHRQLRPPQWNWRRQRPRSPTPLQRRRWSQPRRQPPPRPPPRRIPLLSHRQHRPRLRLQPPRCPHLSPSRLQRSSPTPCRQRLRRIPRRWHRQRWGREHPSSRCGSAPWMRMNCGHWPSCRLPCWPGFQLCRVRVPYIPPIPGQGRRRPGVCRSFPGGPAHAPRRMPELPGAHGSGLTNAPRCRP